ncbi:hypothetical protein [Micromonospora carbonacea]|uniref:hypothetical protein n=1 Tax=Micromonospora carbonacea TaxID=47853 RepID=UPI00183BB3A8|nr:hypothetical protein [Micromonospora carbonacea]MBB5828626.1 hypothetical protein [Micromonospora carbonacea]
MGAPPQDPGASRPESTPLTEEQRRVSESVAPEAGGAVQPGFDYVRRTDARYRSEYLDTLYREAAVAQQELIVLAQQLAHEGDRVVGVAGWRAEPKAGQRAEDKIKKYHGEASRLTDLAAAKVEFDSLGGLYRALDRLRGHPAVRIVEFNDRFRNPQGSGYRDIQLLLRLSDGHVAEFRLHLAALDEVAVWEHPPFEVKRDVEALALEEGRVLTARESAIVGGIIRRRQELFWNASISTLQESA